MIDFTSECRRHIKHKIQNITELKVMSTRVYRTEISTESFEVKRSNYEWDGEYPDNQPFDENPYEARYDEDGWGDVTAESNESQAKSDELALRLCVDLRWKFEQSINALLKKES